MSVPRESYFVKETKEWFMKVDEMLEKDVLYEEGIELWHTNNEYNKDEYHVICWHDMKFYGFYLVYSKSFETRLAAMVIYKKFKDSLYSGNIARMVKHLKGSRHMLNKYGK